MGAETGTVYTAPPASRCTIWRMFFSVRKKCSQIAGFHHRPEVSVFPVIELLRPGISSRGGRADCPADRERRKVCGASVVVQLIAVTHDGLKDRAGDGARLVRDRVAIFRVCPGIDVAELESSSD